MSLDFKDTYFVKILSLLVHPTCSHRTLVRETRLIGPCEPAVDRLSAVPDQVTVPVSAATPPPAAGDGSLHTCRSQNY